ncbi:exodeoxyribonuclease VII large subunit [Candidatus Photodesmus blepharus]|uniref:exodeoxyribonuclease VII large subunit n=1 Tax=Candidatus Photodesmus blepharonis TaxID=1179155 RepID=UPI0005528239|nr:exodeoxyribonuclease VII large subunit [Candidatus Photodesmus blepharus]
MPAIKNKNIFTVSQLNSKVRSLIEEIGTVWLVGEISNFSIPVSGHWYFTLKDSNAQVKCAMFKGNNRSVTFKPKNGKQILVKAHLSLYEPRGDYQLIIENMQPEGYGQLQQQFYELKIKLEKEGLFAQSNKKPFPKHPKCIGVVTSSTGAALFDILDILKRRDPSLSIVIYPTMVQGNGAEIQIGKMIKQANIRNECDLIILGRGGGSLEDLWCFNNEALARIIASSQIPIISAVGHETDITITDFVADMRAPTPSAAAELVSSSKDNKNEMLAHLCHKLSNTIHHYLSIKKQLLTQSTHRIEKQHPNYQIHKQNQQLDILTNRLENYIKQYLSYCEQKIKHRQYLLQLHTPSKQLEQQKVRLTRTVQRLLGSMDKKSLNIQHKLSLTLEKLEALSPLATLRRGYSITQTAQGDVVTSWQSLKTGDKLRTQLIDGEIRSTVN